MLGGIAYKTDDLRVDEFCTFSLNMRLAMRFECRSTFFPKPFEPSHYIRPHDILVRCFSTADTWTTVGRLAVDYLDFARAESEGFSICHVCDDDSAEWEEVYSAIIEPAPDFAELRKDFQFDEAVVAIAFIRQAVFHPGMREQQRFILDSICRMFAEDTAIVMPRETTDLDFKELASLGFRIVAGKNFLFRPNMLVNEYSAADDECPWLFDLEVPADADRYVLDNWDDEGIPPDFEEVDPF